MQRSAHIHRQLREALLAGHMHLVYQPLVRLSDTRVVGLEALCRWSVEPLGAVPPDEFMPAVETAGLLDEYRTWLLATLQHDVPDLLLRHPQLEVSLNFSLTEVARPGWCDDIKAWLHRMPASTAQRWVVEITEHTYSGDWALVTQLVQALRAQGLRFAVDDFGAGASEMQRLQALPFDVIKLDKTWVQQLQLPDMQARVNTVLTYAQQHGQLVVAEGVETQAQAAQVQALGITVAQGYWFDKPQPLTHWLAVPERFA